MTLWDLLTPSLDHLQIMYMTLNTVNDVTLHHIDIKNPNDFENKNTIKHPAGIRKVETLIIDT